MSQGMFKVGDMVIGHANDHESDPEYNGRVGLVTVVHPDHCTVSYSNGDYWWFDFNELEYAKNKIVTDILNDL